MQSEYRSEQWLITEVCLQISDNKICHGLTGFLRVTPNVGHKNNVFKPEQLFRNLGLILEYIKASASQPAFKQSRHEFRFVNV